MSDQRYPNTFLGSSDRGTLQDLRSGSDATAARSRDTSRDPMTSKRHNDKKADHSKFKHFWFNSWAFELLSGTLSIAAFVAIVVLLSHFDGKPVSDWDFSINAAGNQTEVSLNFIVSVLGTFSKTTFAVMISSGLSQAKWNWFKTNTRPLQDFQTFDDASRGPWGSMALLWRTKAMHLASLGALLTLLTLTFDPFLQLVISYPGIIQIVPGNDTAIAYSQNYNRGQVWPKARSGGTRHPNITWHTYSSLPDSVLVAAVNSGFWNPVSRQEPAFACGASNCTWPEYTSLAVCNKCFDMSSQIRFDTAVNETFQDIDSATGSEQYDGTFVSLGNMSMINVNGFIGTSKYRWAESMSARPMLLPNSTVNFKDYQTLLYSLQALKPDRSYFRGETRWQETEFTAQECGLYLCSNTYNSSYVNGRFQETILSSHSERVPSSYGVDLPSDPAIEQYVPDYVRPWVQFQELSEFIYVMKGRRNISYTMQESDAVEIGSDSWNPVSSWEREAYNGLNFLPRYDYQLQLSEEQARHSNVSTFNISYSTLASLTNLFFNFYDCNSDMNWTCFWEAQDGEQRLGGGSASQAIYLDSSISQLFANLATDISAAIRAGGAPMSKNDPSGPRLVGSTPFRELLQVKGEQRVYVVISSITWPFIVVPAFTCFCSFVFLIGSIWQTRIRDTPLFKESVLASLVWGLERETKEHARQEWSAGGKEVMEKWKMRFRGGKRGGELQVLGHESLRSVQNFF